LEIFGFTQAVKIYIKEFQERYKINCSFEGTNLEYKVNHQQSVALYRILQESLNNIAKHAKATAVVVRFNIEENKLIMEIIDNGVGFDSSREVKSDSFGMIGMKERVLLLEGNLFVKSCLGEGTNVRIVMPYKINV
jgi:signal transduction histidine kinase